MFSLKNSPCTRFSHTALEQHCRTVAEHTYLQSKWRWGLMEIPLNLFFPRPQVSRTGTVQWKDALEWARNVGHMLLHG